MTRYKSDNRPKPTYHRTNGGGGGSVTDLTNVEREERRDAWIAIGGQPRQHSTGGIVDKRVKVHPLLLQRSCKQRTMARECIHLEPCHPWHPCKCAWFGHETTYPWKRPRECTADAKAGLIDDVETTEAAE